MPNTYSKIHLQFVFAVKYRRALIDPSWEQELYKYITGIVQNHEHKLLAINGVQDHIHIFVGMRPSQSISDLLRDIKGESSLWINQRKFIDAKFEWQSGYGAFSYSPESVKNVINYIHRQKEHHTNTLFRDEYLELLRYHEIEYDERYIFQDPV
ncbi:MAG: IS200/IS605 family transposase [Bacteroidetes bacterium]|nr:IS200/IS605 family transposase [Bacteroidota bacterium]